MHRHDRAEVGDEVELAAAHQWVKSPRAVLANLGFQRVDLARCEHPRQQLSVNIVDRWIFENHCAGGDVDVGFDEFHDGAAGRTEGLMIHQGLVDIGEAAERVEVVLLVVVQRRLVP